MFRALFLYHFFNCACILYTYNILCRLIWVWYRLVGLPDIAKNRGISFLRRPEKMGNYLYFLSTPHSSLLTHHLTVLLIHSSLVADDIAVSSDIKGGVEDLG